jgi:hypothetical protein
LNVSSEWLAALGRLFRPEGQEARATQVAGQGFSLAGTQGAARYVFRKKGDLWEVTFNGGEPFYLENTLGARYLDYLLHHPNVPMAAFELEVLVTPEKGQARSKESIQPESDVRAKRQYREALGDLQEQRRRANEAGDQAGVRDLDREIKKLSAAVNKRGGMADTGERARSNVRHAVRLVVEQLEEGGPEEQALAEHLHDCLSTGHECQYSQPAGRIWA